MKKIYLLISFISISILVDAQLFQRRQKIAVDTLSSRTSTRIEVTDTLVFPNGTKLIDATAVSGLNLSGTSQDQILLNRGDTIGSASGFEFNDTLLMFDNTLDGTTMIITEKSVRPTSITSGATRNTGYGYSVLQDITSGIDNCAFGYDALKNINGSAPISSQNAAFGAYSLQSLTSGRNNTSIGYATLQSLTTGRDNVALGYSALTSTTGDDNIAIGYQAGLSNIIGEKNIIIGYQAASNTDLGDNNIYIGYQAGINATGSDKLFIGNSSTDSIIYAEMDNNYLKFTADSAEVTGRFDKKQYIGQLYVDGDSTLVLGSTDTYETFAKFVTDTALNTTCNDSSITITEAGWYMISNSASYAYSTSNAIIDHTIFVNDVEQTTIRAERKISTGGDVGSSSNQGVLYLNANDVIKQKWKADNTGTITAKYINFHLVRL